MRVKGKRMSPLLSAAYVQALKSAQPLTSMREIVADELARRDGDREGVLSDLEDLRAMARRDGLDEDAVLDLMDFVSGWCSPHMKIN
jgi:hypothetical protein